jgi:hypothetical protein
LLVNRWSEGFPPFGGVTGILVRLLRVALLRPRCRPRSRRLVHGFRGGPLLSWRWRARGCRRDRHFVVNLRYAFGLRRNLVSVEPCRITWHRAGNCYNAVVGRDLKVGILQLRIREHLRLDVRDDCRILRLMGAARQYYREQCDRENRSLHTSSSNSPTRFPTTPSHLVI